MAGGEEGHIRLLAAEVERLHAAVAKLVASNAELRQAIAEEGDDEDRTFKTAIEENIVVIAKYRAQVERLEGELAELRAGRQPLGTAPPIPTQESGAAAAGSAGAAPAAEGVGERRERQGQQQGQQAGGGDVPMGGAADPPAGTGERQQQPGGDGMWM